MDLSHAIVPKSDQLNADDLMAGPRTYLITAVTEGNAEQPVNVQLEGSRPFRPSKSMLRVMVAAWGIEGDAWVGHRLTLYRDPDVLWAGQAVGGIRISHMTGISEPLKLALTKTKQQRQLFTVHPLPDLLLDTRSPLAASLYAAFDASPIPGPERVAWICRVIGRSIGSTKEMTQDEARLVLDELSQVPPLATEQAPEPQTTEPEPETTEAPTVERDQAPAEEPPATEPPRPSADPKTARPASRAQLQLLFARLGELGVGDGIRHEVVGQIVGREVASFNDLSSGDAKWIIDQLADVHDEGALYALLDQLEAQRQARESVGV